MKLKNLINAQINFKQALKLLYFCLIISILVFTLLYYLCNSEDFLFIFEYYSIELFGVCTLTLLPLFIMLICKFYKKFSKQLKRLFSFICANVFIISINVSIIYIGNKLITEVTNTISNSIEKTNNIVPVATHDGFAIYNRDEDKFFEYKIDSGLSKYYERKTYAPSLEIEDINKKINNDIHN